MSYDIYGQKSIESLTKEFNRTQHEIRKAVMRKDVLQYNMLNSYRQEIMRLIRKQKVVTDDKKKRNDSMDNSNNYYNISGDFNTTTKRSRTDK